MIRKNFERWKKSYVNHINQLFLIFSELNYLRIHLESDLNYFVRYNYSQLFETILKSYLEEHIFIASYKTL